MARTGSVATRTAGRIATGRGQRDGRHGCVGHGKHQRKPLCRSLRGCMHVGLGGRPFTAKSEDLGGACVGTRQVERTVGILRQCDRQLSVGDGGVPVAPAKVGITQMGQARDRVRGG